MWFWSSILYQITLLAFILFKFSIYSQFSLGRLYVSRNVAIISRLFDLFMHNFCSSLIMLCVSMVLVVTSFFIIFYFILIFLIFIFTLFYFKILYWFCHTLTWIRHGCTWVPKHEPPSNLPPDIISLDHPRAPAPSILYPASNIDWWFVSYMIVYMFQCHSPKSSHPLPLPQSPKVRSTHLCLFCCLSYFFIFDFESPLSVIG